MTSAYRAGTSPIEAARARHRLADVAARTGIPLPATSGRVTVRCVLPAHGHVDRSPSLRLYLDDDRYFCFGCGSKGDVVQWARDLTGASVAGAIGVLDSGARLPAAWPPDAPPGGFSPGSSPGRAGAGERSSGRVEVPDVSRTSPQRIRQVLAAAWEHYTHPHARTLAATYLTGRGIDVNVVEAWTGRSEAGFTAGGRDTLTRHLIGAGCTMVELVDAGLARHHDDHAGNRATVVDFYRDRLLLPVRDDDGNIVALIGRDVGGAGPKYLNPPATAVYDKSCILYRPLPIPTAVDGQLVVVEGTIDALAIATAAITAGQVERWCPLTQSGRELSPAQLGWLADTGVPLVLGFDGDRAGADSATRYTTAATRAGVPVAVTLLPGGHDPASWLADTGPAGLTAWDLAAGTRCASGPRPVAGTTWAHLADLEDTRSRESGRHALRIAGRPGHDVDADGTPGDPAAAVNL